MAGIPNPLVDPSTPGSWTSDPSPNNLGGATAQYSNTSATTAATTETVNLTTSGTVRNKYYATLTLANPLNAAIETKIDVTGITPTGYRGTGLMITGISDTFPYSVTYEVGSALGAQTVAGTVSVSGTRFDTGDYGMVKSGRTGLMTNRTQANVQTFYKDQNTLLGTQRGQLFEGLDPNLPFPVALVKAFGETLVQGAINAVETVAEVLTVVGNWISNAVNAAGQIVGEIGAAIVDGIGSTFQNLLDFLRHGFGKGNLPGIGVVTGTNVADLTDAVHNLTDKAFVAVDNTQTLTDFWNEPRQLPAWVGSQSDDVSYPHYLINASANTIFGSGGTTTQDRLILIPVVAGQDRTYDVIKFGVTAITATSLQVALYDVDETTGLATKVVDLGNVISQINTGLTTIQTIQLPQPKTVQKGEVFYIAILASGGTVTLSYSNTISGTSLVNYGRYPRFLASYNTAGTFSVFPATMPNTQLSSDGTFRPFWGSLGVFAPNVIPAKLNLSDSFDRVNASNLGANWSTQYSQFGPGLKIVSNRAQADSGTGSTLSVLVQRMNWLDQRVSATLNRGGYYSEAGLILILRGNGSGKFMYLRVTQTLWFSVQQMTTTAQIYSATSYSQVGTNFQGGTPRSTLYSANNGLNRGPTLQTWKFEAIGNAYYAYLNNSIVRTWTDDGNAFPVNDSYKQVGVGGLYTPDQNDPLGLQTNGVALIDNFSATDL
jgi:hypothetical protein